MAQIIHLKDMSPIRNDGGQFTGSYYWSDPEAYFLLVNKRGLLAMQIIFAPLILYIAFTLGG
jgi:hypothetical protein